MITCLRLATPASAQTADSFDPNSNGEVYGLAIQPDGKILVGGGFDRLGGVAHNCLARLEADGTVDASFKATASNPVFSIAFQPDGKAIVGGWFGALCAQPRGFIGRVNLDGSLDTGFNPSARGGVSDPGVFAIAMQPDGKVLVGGDFRWIGGRACTNIGRLNPEGLLDTNFVASANGVVYSVTLQPDGQILVGGDFTTLCGQPRARIGRLDSNGTPDPFFNPGANDIPLCMAVQPDGKVVCGGPFVTLGGKTRGHIARLNSDGGLDLAFSNNVAGGFVRSLALQEDGKIVIGGTFTGVGGQSRNRIARLNDDGSLDLAFNPGAGADVYAVTIQPDGRIIAGGSFTNLGGQLRNRIGRLDNSDPATDTLTFDGATISWKWGGTAPEMWRTSFEVSTNHLTWVNLGDGPRVPGGWVMTGLDFSTNDSLRARGYVTGGRYGCSTWFVERTLNVDSNAPPVILADDSNFGFSSNRFGFDVNGLSLRLAVIEGSSNLSDWTALGTNALGSGPGYFSDPGSTNFLSRFYRARLQ